MANPTFSQQAYFTKREASEYLRLSPRTIEALLSRGELRASRPGRKLIFKREDLDSLVQRHLIGVDLDKLVDETLAELSGKHANDKQTAVAQAGLSQ